MSGCMPCPIRLASNVAGFFRDRGMIRLFQLTALFASLSLNDILLTRELLYRWPALMGEGNPIAAAMIRFFGEGSLIWLKVATSITGCALLMIAAFWKPTIAYRAMLALCFVVAGTGIYSVGVWIWAFGTYGL